MTRVVAPSRLHFGLLNLPVPGFERWPGLDDETGLPVRHFGGVGLMIDRPGISLRVEPANDWQATGPLSERALLFAKRFIANLPPEEARPFRITVEHAAAEHTGLGVGTQLGLAVAKALAIETEHEYWTTQQLAAMVGRGERSAIGVHGFERGGLLVEGGKPPGVELSPLIAHFDFPEEWAVLLFTPTSDQRWHGGAEREAFTQLGSNAIETDRLCRLVLLGILPGIANRDLSTFGESVYEFNARVGELFAPVQGGRYVSGAVGHTVSRLRALGVRGVGQSSWGPTVFAVIHRDEADSVVKRMGEPTVIASGWLAATR